MQADKYERAPNLRGAALKRVMMRVAYDGTAYCGWQLQPGKPTIEGELNRALLELLGEEITVIGASRTDAGYILWEMLRYLIQIPVFRLIKSVLRSIRDCRRILSYRSQQRWRRTFIRDTATAEKPMNTAS